jgi:ubiquinone/menaquinone biosynthesis C-methylase UbiE
MKEQASFFDFAAEVGLTKHIGGVAATRALVELCHIRKDSYVLDVGCGAGVTPCLLTRQVGCRVVGVDILEGMVAVSRQRARREGLMDRLEFRVADAQALPFEDDLFDAVITESVTAFPPDKPAAVREYARVTRPGGYVGLNESTWIQYPPPPEMIAWATRDVGANVMPLTATGWSQLLQEAGLKEISAQTFAIDVQDESKAILRRYGCSGMLGVFWRMANLYLRSAAYRKFVKGVGKEGVAPKNLADYFGYGLYVGRK